MRKSVIMMPSTGRERNVVGKKIKGDSYYGYTDGLHTVQITYSNFTGGFQLQGTLALEPEEEDWFNISLASGTTHDDHIIKFPLTGVPNTKSERGDTGSMAFTFIGNFLWLRAILTREYIDPPVQDDAELGQIQKVLLSL